MMVSGLAIDSGYSTATVYSWVRDKNPSKIFAIKGQASLKQVYSQPRIVDIRLNDGKRIPRGARVWSVGTDILKSELYSFLNAKRLDNGSFPYGYLHFPEYNEEFFKQLVSEQCIRKNQKNGGFSTEWVKKRDRNEVLDTTNYARACAAILGIDRYNNQHWNELEERKKTGSVSGNVGRNTVKHRRQISRGIQ
jgi:phage terminase large subunit GpA-like protein